MTISKAQWDLDVRVRDRNLKNGLIKAEDVATMLAALPDVGDAGLSVDVAQPAVGADVEPEPEADPA